MTRWTMWEGTPLQIRVHIYGPLFFSLLISIADDVSQDPFIRITPHPRSGLPVRETIGESEPSIRPLLPERELPPYVPFASEGDFKFAQSRILRHSSAADINMDLKFMRDGTWAQNCTLSFDNAAHLFEVVDESASIYNQVRHFRIGSLNTHVF